MPLRILASLLLAAGIATSAHADMLDRPGVSEFIDEMVQQGFERATLEQLFRDTEMRDDIIAAITRPAEGKPWHQNRPLFLTEQRINEGVQFWNKNAKALAAAEKKYGVPAAVIVAIIGVPPRTASWSSSQRTSVQVAVASPPTARMVSPLARPAAAAAVEGGGSPTTGYTPGTPATNNAQ